MRARWCWLGVLCLSLWCCDPVGPTTEPSIERQQEVVGESAGEQAPEASNEKADQERRESSQEAVGTEPLSDLSAESSAEQSIEGDAGQVEGVAERPDATQEERPDVTQEERPDVTPNDLCTKGPVQTAFENDTVTVSCVTQADGTRRYTMSTTHALRDNEPASKQISFSERPDAPRLRSGNLLFDALWAMAIEEAHQNSVQSVFEGGFNQGKPVNCACFQTGAKWTWAWTRDTAYAVDLALAWMDPVRAENTLMFKLSSWKASVGGASAGTQIVQDTGTGGAWPISSDRVIWALAGRKLFWALSPTQRDRFLRAVYPALTGTIAQDREMIFDASDGLYRGEQSFLDWREQTYPAWVKERLEHIAMSKTLSTNVAHLILLGWAAEVAGALQQTADAARYQAWAQSLKTTIHSAFYLSGWGMHSTMKTTLLEDAPVAKFDLLGQSLAILEGVVQGAEALQAVSSYPASPMGPPVYWPQQPLIPIYHNRAIWPFVTAYWAQAARRVGHAESLAHSIRSLVRAAALNLSNMENLEWMTGKNSAADGAYSGPVVNSRRQLWSVAGYVSSVAESLMGWEVQSGGLRIRPLIPAALHREGWLQGVVRLEGMPYQGGKVDIEVHLPTQAGGSGAYGIDRMMLNGQVIADPQAVIAASRWQGRSVVSVWLRDQGEAAKPLKIVRDTGDYRALWSPKEPTITGLQKGGGGLAVDVDAAGETGVVVDLYRDGRRIATQIQPGRYVDSTAKPDGDIGYCYSAELIFLSSGHRSHRALPRCWKGEGEAREQIVDAWRFEHRGGKWADHAGGAAFVEWGDRDHLLESRAIRVRGTGRYHVDLLYRNPHGSRNTGITAVVKRVQIFASSSATPIAIRWVAMPHSEQTDVSASTGFLVDLDARQTYRVRVDEAPNTLHNMSFLEHFSIYSGVGGGALPWNRVELVGVRMFPKQAAWQPDSTGRLIALDGKSDYDKFPTTQAVSVGAALAVWERFALTWDAEWLYIAVVNQGFEADLRAYMLYIESLQGTTSAAQASTGMSYLQQIAQLPFTPTHLIGVRYKADNQDGFGPWNGVWRKEANGWALQQRLKEGREIWRAADRHTLACRIHRSQLGDPTRIRLAGHLVYGVAGNEWKGLVPASHTPWSASASGYLEIDLGADTATSFWVTR